MSALAIALVLPGMLILGGGSFYALYRLIRFSTYELDGRAPLDLVRYGAITGVRTGVTGWFGLLLVVAGLGADNPAPELTCGTIVLSAVGALVVMVVFSVAGWTAAMMCADDHGA